MVVRGVDANASMGVIAIETEPLRQYPKAPEQA